MKKNHEKQGDPYLPVTISAGTASASGIGIAETSLPDGSAVAVKAAGQVIILPNFGG
jgi:hypothetical protein